MPDTHTYAAETGRAVRAADGRPQAMPKGDRQPADADTFGTWEKLKKEAMKRRAPWLDTWQEIYDYVMPLRESFLGGAPAESRTDLIYDETAVQAMPKLAGRLTAGYLPEYGEIFSLEAGPDAPDHMKGIEGRMKLETLTRWIHESWQNSNLGIEASEGMLDFAIGTMNLCQEPGRYPGDVVFQSVDPSSIAILPGPHNSVKGWFTWKKMALEDVFATWPNARREGEIARTLQREPRKEVTVECATWRTSSDDDERYRYVVVLPDFRKPVYEYSLEGEGSCPWSTTRWSKTGREVWGRGCVMLAMPAIKTANITVQMILENAELALGGMWTYTDDGVFDPTNVTLQPGTFIPKSREGTIEALPVTARFDVGQLELAEMRANIKKALYVDEMDSKGETPLSAYELQQRRADIARDLTAPGSRITKELIVPHVNRTIWIFERQGLLDAAGLRVDGKRLRIRVKSPFLRGQDAIEMNDILTGAGQMNAIFGQGTAGMVFRLDETIAGIAKRNGISLAMIKSEKQMAEQGAAAGAAAAQGAAGGALQPGEGTALMGTLIDAAKAG